MTTLKGAISVTPCELRVTFTTRNSSDPLPAGFLVGESGTFDLWTLVLTEGEPLLALKPLGTAGEFGLELEHTLEWESNSCTLQKLKEKIVKSLL